MRWRTPLVYWAVIVAVVPAGAAGGGGTLDGSGAFGAITVRYRLLGSIVAAVLLSVSLAGAIGYFSWSKSNAREVAEYAGEMAARDDVRLFALFLDDFLGCPRHEVGIAQLGIDFPDLVGELFDLLAESGPFGLQVDDVADRKGVGRLSHHDLQRALRGCRGTFDPLDPGGTMTSAMVLLASGSDQVTGDSSAFQSLFFVGLLLFVITFALNLLGEAFVRRARQRY